MQFLRQPDEAFIQLARLALALYEIKITFDG
jgi:hypothetical protein